MAKKYIDAEKLKKEIENLKIDFIKFHIGIDPELVKSYLGYRSYDNVLSLIDSLQQEETDMGEVSDGYHTFNELYYYRMLYNAAFFNLLPKKWVHKSKRHHTGEECFGGGWFIVMANLPTGQISNHYELKNWDLFKVPEKEFADEWDGHTPQEAAERLHRYLQQEQKDILILNKSDWEKQEQFRKNKKFGIPLQQEQSSLPSNLDEAANKFAVSYDQGTCDGIAQECFKAGAEWMARQMKQEKHAELLQSNRA